MMIQALNRGLSILEFVAQEPGRSRTLAEISRRLDLHPATCMNLVRTLAAGGYLEQEAPRGGYRAGPMIYRLAGGQGYRPDLMDAARPALERLTRATGETSLLAVLSADRRFIVLRVEGSGDIRVREEIIRREAESVYRTATGRVLLAWQAPEERRRFLSRHGSPGPDAWPEAAGAGGAREALAAIRRTGAAVIVSGEAVTVGVPVRGPGGKIIAALGMPLPEYRFRGARRAKILAAMGTAAAEIAGRFPARGVGKR